jgi:outer membrane protein assembly factor BamB
MRQVLSLLSVLVLLAPARGDEPTDVKFPGESRPIALRLDTARKRLDEQKWPEAIDELQAILHTAGDDLVPVTPTHSVQARRLCQIQIASLPPAALRLYRQRYDTQARKKLEPAQAARDVPQLRKIVDEMFGTRAAEKAIDLLGDLAFERGRFDEAEEWWRLLAPVPDARRDQARRGLALVYPDPTLDPARLQAKQLLARLFHGPGREWAVELDNFRRRHGRAEGALAGCKGRYADLLRALAEDRKKEKGAADADWPTFGGEPSRGRVIPAPDDILDRLSALCRAGPTWRFDLHDRKRQQETPPRPAVNESQARSLAFYPILVGDQVLVADARYVTAYDLRTGRGCDWYDVYALNGGVKPDLKLPAPSDLRYTLTAADEDVYVRLGTQDVGVEGPPKVRPLLGQVPPPPRDCETFLACLSLRPDREGQHFRWRIRGRTQERAFFEGSPLVAGGQIWISSARYNSDRRIASIECYAPDDAGEPPLRWRRELCDTRAPKPGEPIYRHHLLMLAGTQLVYCSHTGAVIAVDALTGRTNWALRYPSRAIEKDEQPPFRDLAPVLFADGRLYVAPADSDRLLCLDPATGRILWEREALKVVHLLGVGQGRLIFTTSVGLHGVDAADGRHVWLFPQAGQLPPAGRGLLIGDMVLFPTMQHNGFSLQTRVYEVRQSDGEPAGDPSLLHGLPVGNLAYANGCLAVTDLHTLSVFVPPRLLLPERKAEARLHPESAAILLKLGRAEAGAGLVTQAIQTFLLAESRARDLAPSRRQRALLDQARNERQHALLEFATRAAAAKRWDDAATAFRQAAAVQLPARARLHALTRAAQLWQDARQLDRARAVWESILADETLRPIQVIDKNGTPNSAAAHARLALAHLRGEPMPIHSRPPRQRPHPAEAEAAEPSLPLFRTWHASLGAEEWVLAGWRTTDTELLLTGSSEGSFFCRGTRTGEVRWQHRLPFVPSWAGCHADMILAGGERGVACLHRDSGEPVWHFPAPASGLYPTAPVDGVRVVQDPQTPEPLTDFRLVFGRLFFLQGQRRLFALDAETGEVLWHRWAPDGGFHLPYPQGCFSPCYHAGGKTVLLQTIGQRWLLDAATGRLIHQAPDGPDLWQRPPLELDERSLCAVSDKRHIVLLDALTGQSRWTHTLNGETTRSGEVPQVLGRGDMLLLVVPMNFGYFLQRLDRATGKPVWPRPHLLTMKTLDTFAWAFDREAVYFVEDRSLIARSLADGRVMWQHPLDAADGWHVRRVGDFLMVYPVPSGGESQFRFRSPLGSVQWKVDSSLKHEAVFTVACHDPKTGKLVQRLNFRIESPARMTCAARSIGEDRRRSLVIQASSLLASEDGPVVRIASPRPFVAVGGDVWGLSAAPKENHSPASASR